MSRFRLPGNGLYMTDGGLETELVFHDGIDLPAFAAFVLLEREGGAERLLDYYDDYLQIAAASGTGFVLESPTWRANPDWLEPAGCRRADLRRVNTTAIALMQVLRARYQAPAMPIVISGCVGPRGDGYDPGQIMHVDEAREYHAQQIGTLVAAGADMVTGMTINNVPEAAGIAAAAADANLPVVISFTVETDGRLPDGHSLGAAISAVDAVARPAYYMLNCAHPEHFIDALLDGRSWRDRIGGIRANASLLSHAELDAAETLDDGDPHDLGRYYKALRKLLPALRVIGGCCGTDHRHVREMARQCVVPETVRTPARPASSYRPQTSGHALA